MIERLDQAHAIVVRHVLALGREQVVDDERPRAASVRRAARARGCEPTKPAPPTTRIRAPASKRPARVTAVRRRDLQVREGLRRCRTRGSTRSPRGHARLERRADAPAVEVLIGPRRVEQDREGVVRARAGAPRPARRARCSSASMRRVEELLDREVRARRDVVRARGPRRRRPASTTTSIRSST